MPGFTVSNGSLAEKPGRGAMSEKYFNKSMGTSFMTETVPKCLRRETANGRTRDPAWTSAGTSKSSPTADVESPPEETSQSLKQSFLPSATEEISDMSVVGVQARICGGGDSDAAKTERSTFILVRHSFRSFCEATSLHGWKYVSFETATNCERATWLLLLLLSLTTASFLVFRAVQDFLSHTVATNMESLSASFRGVYFPAITVCNMNFLQRSVLEKYNLHNNDSLIDVFDRMINVGTQKNFTDEELKMFEHIERISNGSARLKMEGHPKCHNMFLMYLWKGAEVPVTSKTRTMHYQQTTDESVCCQIFPGMLPSENNHKFDISNMSFWTKEPNPWQIIFDGYKSGITPGKLGVQVCTKFEALHG